MKYVYVYHSAEVIDTFVFNQSHCVPVVRPLMDHNNKHSAYHQVHCRTRTIISHFFQETWHCPENRRLCQWLEKTKSKRLRTFSYEVMQDINNGVQWFNLLPRKSRIWMMGVFFPHLGGWKRRRSPYLLSWWWWDLNDDNGRIRKMIWTMTHDFTSLRPPCLLSSSSWSSPWAQELFLLHHCKEPFLTKLSILMWHHNFYITNFCAWFSYGNSTPKKRNLHSDMYIEN